MIDEVKEINTESNYKSTYQALTIKKLPNYILLSLMQIFEDYRSKRKIGWSRPWNKYNLCTFQSYRWDIRIDNDIFSLLRIILLQNIHFFDENSEFFIRDILNDPRAQGFLFFHDHKENIKDYEGMTLSFGRFSTLNKRFRDRIDIILESQIINRTSTQKLDSIKIYVDPHNGDTKLPQVLKLDKSFLKTHIHLKNLFEILIKKYHIWEHTEREWYHWSQKFVPYFGERNSIPINTLFFNQRQNLYLLDNEEQLKTT
ncbi:hypothetical protein [Fluviispira multicolorata]|uniref:Uncharacterized protein n=1 Tax=Fluviispira multicolorata TaxID=2654512 RepID=A0A833N4U5_9BACT|nr:hypothetical protein [Fluviispira multicolorata]KAB8029048.1 hypothetical protein GCL57_10935 [Fluviispira multicolorata]